MEFFFALILIAVVLIWVRIFSRAGYSAWWALLIPIPMLGLVVMLVFAMAEWPIVQENRELKRKLALYEAGSQR